MWNKIIIWIARLGSIALVFIAPITYLIWKYGGSETELVEVTTNSMPILILFIISIFVLVVIMWLGSQVLVVYWEYVKKHPFGEVSVFTFGGVILALTVLINLWLAKLNDIIEYNAEQFLTDISLYKDSLIVIIWYVAIGLALAVFGFIWNKATA
jgi:hypothetical protein